MVSLVNECWQKHHVCGVACEGYSVWSTDSNITFVVSLVNECWQTHHVCGVASEGYSIWSKCIWHSSDADSLLLDCESAWQLANSSDAHSLLLDGLKFDEWLGIGLAATLSACCLVTAKTSEQRAQEKTAVHAYPSHWCHRVSATGLLRVPPCEVYLLMAC